MIVWLASYPRSGNTYLRVVLATLYGRRSTTRYPTNRPRDKALPPYESLPAGTLEEMAASPETHLVKTHDLPGDDRHPALYVVRDGRDALVSYARYVAARQEAPGPVQNLRDILSRLVLERRSPFGTWGQNVQAWVRRPRTAVIRFEEMIQSVEKVAAGVEALGLGWQRIPGAVVPSFAELKQMRPNNFQRGQVGGWQDDLPSDLHELFWRECGTAMEALGYPRSARGAA